MMKLQRLSNGNSHCNPHDTVRRIPEADVSTVCSGGRGVPWRNEHIQTRENGKVDGYSPGSVAGWREVESLAPVSSDEDTYCQKEVESVGGIDAQVDD